MAGMSAGQPPRFTTAMALVRGVISGAMVAAVIVPEFESTSAKIGFAPRSTALDAVAVSAGVVISSYWFMR